MSRMSLVLGALLALVSTASATVPPDFHNVKIAHTIIATLVFALLLPLGAIIIRVFTFRGILWFHAGWMIFCYALSLIVLGTGIYMAYYTHFFNTAHSIIGIVVICGCILQPFTGIAHHMLYKSVGRPNKATYPHVWLGRALITLGALNGGLGLQLGRSTRGIEIGYGVGAGIVWALWMAVTIAASVRSRGKLEGETGKKILGQEKIISQRYSDQQVTPVHSTQISSTGSDKDLEVAVL